MTSREKQIEVRLAQLDARERELRGGRVPVPTAWRARALEEVLGLVELITRGMALNDTSTETAMAERRRAMWLRQELGAISIERRALDQQRPVIDDPPRIKYPGGVDALRTNVAKALYELRKKEQVVTKQAVATKLGIDRGTLASYIQQGIIPPIG